MDSVCLFTRCPLASLVGYWLLLRYRDGNRCKSAVTGLHQPVQQREPPASPFAARAKQKSSPRKLPHPNPRWAKDFCLQPDVAIARLSKAQRLTDFLFHCLGQRNETRDSMDPFINVTVLLTKADDTLHELFDNVSMFVVC